MQESNLVNITGSERAERKPYDAPVLKVLGDVVSLTKAEYEGLAMDRFGFYFAMASGAPGPPPAPFR